MLSVTIQECMNAAAGLTELAKYPFPLQFGIRVARLRFAAQTQVDRVNEAHRAVMLAAADLDGDRPVIQRNETTGVLSYRMTPEAQYTVEMEYEKARLERVDVDALPLTFAEIPATLRDKPTELPPEIFVALGPFLVA